MEHIFSTLLKRIKFLNRLDPARDWIVLLIISILVLVCIVVWNAWAFDMIANGGTIGSSATSTQPVLKSATIGDVHSIFEKRAAEEVNYMSGVYQYADPSL